MANEKRGERAVEIGGKTYTLRLDFNTVCEAEEHFSRTPFEILITAQQGGGIKAKEVRGFFFEAARGQHGLGTLEAAGRVIAEHPGALITLAEVFVTALDELFPGKADAEGN